MFFFVSYLIILYRYCFLIVWLWSEINVLLILFYFLQVILRHWLILLLLIVINRSLLLDVIIYLPTRILGENPSALWERVDWFDYFFYCGRINSLNEFCYKKKFLKYPLCFFLLWYRMFTTTCIHVIFLYPHEGRKHS